MTGGLSSALVTGFGVILTGGLGLRGPLVTGGLPGVAPPTGTVSSTTWAAEGGPDGSFAGGVAPGAIHVSATTRLDLRTPALGGPALLAARAAASRVGFQVTASATVLPLVPDGTIRPRYQIGQPVTVEINPRSKLDLLPTATLFGPSGSVVAMAPMVLVESPVGSWVYRAELTPGGGSPLGTYIVRMAWTLGGSQVSNTSFDLVGGGDSGGAVIALYYQDRPEARYVLAQLSSGKIVQGRNPSL